jgi:hypothetical protein
MLSVKNATAEGMKLYSRLHVAAKPIYPRSVIRTRVLSLPNAVQDGQGTIMTFRLRQGPKSSAGDPVLSLDGRSIALKFFFDEPSLKVHRTYLAMFVSLLSYLNDLYEIDIGHLYPAIVEAVSGVSKDLETARNLSEIEAMEERIKELSRSNVYLSRIILELETRSSSAESKAEGLRKAFLRMFRYFSDQEGGDIRNAIESMQSFGFSKEELQQLIEECGVSIDKRLSNARQP